MVLRVMVYCLVVGWVWMGSVCVAADGDRVVPGNDENPVFSLKKELTREQRESISRELNRFAPRLQHLMDVFVSAAPSPDENGVAGIMPNSGMWTDARALFAEMEVSLEKFLSPDQIRQLHSELRALPKAHSTQEWMVKSKKEDSQLQADLSACNYSDCFNSPYYQEWARFANYLGYTNAYYHYTYEKSGSNAYPAYSNALTAGGQIKSAMKYAGPAYFAVSFIGNVGYENGECYTKIAFDYANIAEDYAYFAWDYATDEYNQYGGTYGYYSQLYNYYAMKFTDYARDYAYTCQNCCNN